MTSVSIARFLTDKRFLGSAFTGPSWEAWIVTLKAALGEPLTRRETERFTELAGRSPPRKRVEECWFAIGRRAGKDSVASGLAAYLAAFGNFQDRLRPGERATILCLAVDREQARIVHGYIAAYFREIETLKPLLVNARDDIVSLNNGVDIIVATNSFRGLRGKTVACAILDECAFWRDQDYSNPDVEVLAAIRPAMATMRQQGAMIVGISTTHRKSGLLYDKITAHAGKDDDKVLAILAPSLTYNPSLDPEMIEADLVTDFERANAEWNSVWRSDLSDLFDRETVMRAVDKGRLSNLPRPGVTYLMAADPSGGRGDAFTAAIGHLAGDQVIIDKVAEWRAPFDSEQVMDEVAALAATYRINTVYHDDYGADLVVAGFRRRGLTSKRIALFEKGQEFKLSRSEIYLDALPHFTSGRVRLPDEPRLIHQLISLERRPSSSGRDRVDHPQRTGGHDDVANATCAAIVLLATQYRLTVSNKVLTEVKDAILNPMQAYQKRAYEAELALGPNATAQERWRAATSAEVTFGTPEPKVTARLDCTKALILARGWRSRQ